MPGGPKRERQRLDVLLVDRGLAPSREKAQALILTGDVLIDDVPFDKPGHRVHADASIRIRGDGLAYVGRGGDKLAGALEHFGVDLSGVVAIDVGASTGGFTDCMLQRGAAAVYAVDVGYNQLADRLRRDTRVRVMERTHAKDLRPELFEPAPAFATVDVSFISVRKVLAWLLPVLTARAEIMVLVKPQFELGPELVGKGGVVRSTDDQAAAVRLVSDWGAEHGLDPAGSVPSTLRGAKKGNQEYFVLFRRARSESAPRA